jgi:E3 ubiquitin-protein ligase SHPRH
LGLIVITIDDIIGTDINIKTAVFDIVLLSSVRNASGLDFSNIRNVIIMDPFENYTYCKSIERQIIGRVHRIGQTREVYVYRPIMLGTYEERIYTS